MDKINTSSSHPCNRFCRLVRNKYNFHPRIFCTHSTSNRQHAIPDWELPVRCTGREFDLRIQHISVTWLLKYYKNNIQSSEILRAKILMIQVTINFE